MIMIYDDLYFWLSRSRMRATLYSDRMDSFAVDSCWSSLPSSSSSWAATEAREVDPLLKDLSEKRQSFRRNVESLAAELKGVRSRLAALQHSLAVETTARQEAETKAEMMEEEICRLHKSLEEKDGQLKASECTAEKYLKELDDLRSQLLAAQATAYASASSAESVLLQCLELLKELDRRNGLLKEHENILSKLGKLLDLLQNDLEARESSQKQMRDEVLRIEHGIMQATAESRKHRDYRLAKTVYELSGENFDKINKLLTVTDELIAELGDEIRTASAHWKHKISIAGTGRWNMMKKCYLTKILFRLFYFFLFYILGWRLISYFLIVLRFLLKAFLFLLRQTRRRRVEEEEEKMQ
ncbi:nuclear envelope-associated protein 2-like [Malania oleifera]|uniref:nuclear envelope-associated protein 2-like n=1 Tax=Malania oleifera TaxID=397392 RepID=UPI0025AE1A92|nr:nuclear envelope-associated protein 2-like [Malania oleifera]